MPSATWLLVAACLHAGCAAPLSTSYLHGPGKQDAKVEPEANAVEPADNPRSAALRKATAAAPQTSEQALAGVLDELHQIRAIDAEAEAQLMADLEQAKPEDYAMIVTVFRNALAYRQQLAERQRRAADENALIAAGDDSLPPLPSQQTIGTDRESTQRASAVQASLASARSERAARKERRSIHASATRKADANRYAVVEPASALRPSVPAETLALRPTPMATALTPVELPSEPYVPEQTAIASDQNSSRRTADVVLATATAPGDWHAELEASIANLQRTVSPKPTSVAELHDHMRLRTLQLLAGREEEAYRAVPGASPDQQDYWSKQLFAMSAYLDGGGKLDDKQRAAAALGALDEARAKLSELATLQIRNAAFVASVDGFGAYEPSKAKSFQPGQKVTLYAEVENFRSSATEDGHYTSLATSYQVLDKTGRRVDGKQFPDVADKCRNRRRDFHMQYEFPLPTRIYPGEYELELTITDHNSGKIGQTTLPFEIAGDK